MRIVDLRSDTVTKPSPEMWEAIRSMDNSKIGDDVQREDPTVNELEEKAAKIMGKEAALFVTSGSQGNLISLLSQTKPGDEILLDEMCHIYTSESGTAARFGGLLMRQYFCKNGIPDVEHFTHLVKDGTNIHHARTSLIAAENTHNFHGGIVIPPENLKKLKQYATEKNLKFHLDGARIFNAAVASRIDVKQFSKYPDSIMFCLSKGLCCPIGSLVVGTNKLISKARKYRKMLGGGWRQAGIIAAMGLIALENKWISRLREDHDNAKVLAKGIQDFNLPITIQEPETNIIFFQCDNDTMTSNIINSLDKEGIKALYIGNRVRLVTHYGITKDDIEYSVEKIGSVLKQCGIK